MKKITTLAQLRVLITNYQDELIAAAKKSGGVWENFGQDKVRAVREVADKLTDFDSAIPFHEREAVRVACENFNAWACSYSLFWSNYGKAMVIKPYVIKWA